MDDLSDHPFALFMEGERETESDRRWERYVRRVERLLGRELDGDEGDGYSLDGAYAAYEAGLSPQEYFDEVRQEGKRDA